MRSTPFPLFNRLLTSGTGSASSRATHKRYARSPLPSRRRADLPTQAFIPFTNLLASPATPPPSTLPFPPGTSSPSLHTANDKSVFIHAQAVEIGDGWVEVDRDLEGECGEGGEGVEGLVDVMRGLGMGEGRRRVEWDYLVYVRPLVPCARGES